MNSNINQKHIILVIDTLSVGGAEIFTLRLAAALQDYGFKVSIVVLRGDLISWPHYNSIANKVELILISIPLRRLILKLDGLFYMMGIGFSLLRTLQVFKLINILRANYPYVVHSSLLTTDVVVSRACSAIFVPWISTMHGDYLAIEHTGFSRAGRILNFLEVLKEINRSVDHIVCISDQQKLQMSRLMHSIAKDDFISKIYNGYPASLGNELKGDVPEILRLLPNSDFVVGMVARGVRDKGWDVLIDAFEAIELPDAWLLLIGDGDHLQQIKSITNNPRIIFCGSVFNPLNYIERFNVACLPTLFHTESLPTVIIEYLNLGKPVIATAVGEIPKMLDADSDEPAGLLIDLQETGVMTKQLQNALVRLYQNKFERDVMSTNALKAFKKFDMNVCLNAYLKVYEQVQG